MNRNLKIFVMVVTAFACTWLLEALAYADPPASASEDFIAEMIADLTQQNQASDEAPSSNPHVRPYAAIIKDSIWRDKTVYVCWENPSPESQKAMEWTKDAVSQTWEKESGVRFSGWSACAEKNAGIRIRIEDSGPHVKALGRYLDKKKEGMVLNFTFNNWSTECQKQLEYCIRIIAVHEFGHAIGFVHEQNRPDAPGECKTLAQGTNPDSMLTPYDPESVMNYCNKKWSNDGVLSTLDIAAVREMYGPPER
jgi:hypothetical protein